MASSAFNIADHDGSYWQTWLNAAMDAHVQYTSRTGGTLSDVTVTSTHDLLTPRLCILPWRRAILTYTRPRDMTEPEVEAAADPNYVTIAGIAADFPTGINGVPAIYERVSDDEGQSWSGETLLTTYGLSPTPVVSPDGTLLRAFVRSQNFPYGPYGAQPSQYSPYGMIQYPGETSPGAIYHFGPLTGGPPTQPPFARITAPQAYGLCWTPGNVWYLHWPLSSLGQTALYHSHDDGATWAQGRFPRAVIDGGNVKLGVASAPDGGLMLWSIQDQTGTTSQIVTGYAEPGQVFPDPGVGGATFGVAGANLLKDDTGANFDPGFEEDVSWTSSWDSARRWIMATRLASDTDITAWQSWNEGLDVILLP